MPQPTHKRRTAKKPTKKPKGRKLSVMVIHRTKDAMSLTAAVESYKTRMAAAIAERYAPRLGPGETLPDYEMSLELAARDVKAALGRLIELDDATDDASVKQLYLRRERDQLVRERIHPHTVAVRGAIDLAFGRQRGVYVHGMRGRTRRRPKLLQDQLRRALLRLSDADCQLPPPKNAHAFVDREGWNRQLEPLHRKLADLNRRLSLGDHAVPALVAKKRAAREAFDEAYADALCCVVAGMRMARFDQRFIKNLKPYYLRRRLSKNARTKRRARATAKSATAKSAAAKSAEAMPREVPTPKRPGGSPFPRPSRSGSRKAASSAPDRLVGSAVRDLHHAPPSVGHRSRDNPHRSPLVDPAIRDSPRRSPPVGPAIRDSPHRSPSVDLAIRDSLHRSPAVV